MQDGGGAGGAVLDLKFRPEYRCVNHARLLINSFMLLQIDDRTLAGRVAMTGAELIDNSVKRATSDLVVLRVKVFPDTPIPRVRVETENEASLENIRTLTKTLESIGQGNAVDAYIRALQAIPDNQAGATHLGLARIRYEGKMQIRCEVDGKRVRMMAETTAD